MKCREFSSKIAVWRKSVNVGQRKENVDDECALPSFQGETFGVQQPLDDKSSGGKAAEFKRASGAVKRTSSETCDQINPVAVTASSRTVTDEPLECSGMHFINPAQVDVDVIPMEDGSDDDGDVEIVESVSHPLLTLPEVSMSNGTSYSHWYTIKVRLSSTMD